MNNDASTILLGRRPNGLPEWHLALLLSNDCWLSVYAYFSIKAAISIHFRRAQLRRGDAKRLIKGASLILSLTVLVLVVFGPDWNMHPATKGIKWPQSMQKTETRHDIQ